MITEETPAWWNGCWLEPGHYLFDSRGRTVRDRDARFPLAGMTGLDAGYAPRRHKRWGAICYTSQCGGFAEGRSRLFSDSEELPQGQFLRHWFEARDATMLTWWDRAQGDTRGNCNSCFIVKGEHSTADMLEAFPKLFPLQAKCIEDGGPVPARWPNQMSTPFQLVEVFVTPTPIYRVTCPACKRPIYETRYPSAADTTLAPHRGPNWQPGSNDYCKGSGVRVRWVAEEPA